MDNGISPGEQLGGTQSATATATAKKDTLIFFRPSRSALWLLLPPPSSAPAGNGPGLDDFVIPAPHLSFSQHRIQFCSEF